LKVSTCKKKKARKRKREQQKKQEKKDRIWVSGGEKRRDKGRKGKKRGRVEFTGRHRNTLRLLFHIYTV